jgi:catechol 2,3-dioxygenase
MRAKVNNHTMHGVVPKERSSRPIDPGVEIGHVHLRTADIDRVHHFYVDILGFDVIFRMPDALFLSAGGYHHHVGLNSWHSRGGSRPPDDVPGLRLVELELDRVDALDTLERRLAETQGSRFSRGGDGALTVLDPDGQPLAFHRR